jgi:hypothetical protein
MISGHIIKVGNHVEIAGMYVTIMRKMNIMPNKLTYGLYSAGISDEQKRGIVEVLRVPKQ